MFVWLFLAASEPSHVLLLVSDQTSLLMTYNKLTIIIINHLQKLFKGGEQLLLQLYRSFFKE